MNYLCIADTHFGHNKLLEEDYGARPYCFESIILSELQKTVSKADVIIHFGDVSFYRHDFWHRELLKIDALRKWLILGNHDTKSISWYLDKGWDFVATEAKLSLYGKEILLSHKPIELDNSEIINVHGHLHKKEHREFSHSNRHYLVSMEFQNYKPVSLRTLIGA